jgi:branched-subunit amino acid ABC-type transport system permease component
MKELVNKVFRISQRGYYWSFAMLALAVGLGYLLSRFVKLDRTTEIAIALQSLVFIMLLTSLPAILWWFHRQTVKLPQIVDKQECERRYIRLVWLRFFVVEFNIVVNILLFFLFVDKSFFMCAAIAAILLLFCRPDEHNIAMEMGFVNTKENSEKEEE